MRIKKLILHGFKSFAERTEFGFEKGITVIVGPNGCGKSNIVDAVKWVLGEQRPSSLRGKEMQDVIFSGTDSRKGVGFAEVSLVFDNTDGLLPIEYDEVSVSRRLYRSGESEYEINGNAVRLRDVRELMMDSGGGPGAFSVMEQGNIDRLMRADPLERRQVFEEAAGIAKYRARRSETGRKLDRTKENLDRLRDLMGEYETRERSLKIQAGKARRFEEFTDELKKKRVASALARYADLARRQEETQRELEAIAQAERDARDKLEEGMTQSSERRREQDAFRDRVSKGETEIARLVGEDRASAEKKAARQRESDELEVRADEAEREGAEAARRARDLEIDLERAREERDDAGSARDARNDALSAAEALLAEVEARLELMRQESETLDRKRTASRVAPS